MCTLAWNVSADGLWVCFNRDENRDRPRAQQPRVHACGQHRIAYACDPEGGGTWLAVSSSGFIVALMNNYEQAFELCEPLVSRGKLVLEIARQGSPGTAQQQVHTAVNNASYAPFYLFLLTHVKPFMWSWNGSCLSETEGCPKFWTSSSYRPQQVFEWRRREWEENVGSPAFSLQEAAAILGEIRGDPAFSMTMDRRDARTVSQSTIWLRKNGMQFQYAERSPEGAGYMDPVVCGW